MCLMLCAPLDWQYLIVLNFRGTYFRGRRFRKVSREFIFADILFWKNSRQFIFADHKFLNISREFFSRILLFFRITRHN